MGEGRKGVRNGEGRRREEGRNGGRRREDGEERGGERKQEILKQNPTAWTQVWLTVAWLVRRRRVTSEDEEDEDGGESVTRQREGEQSRDFRG